MHQTCEVLWETGGGEWPEDSTDSVFITFPKKDDKKQCTNCQTIALVPHTGKIILKTIVERMRTKTDSEVADAEAGFR